MLKCSHDCGKRPIWVTVWSHDIWIAQVWLTYKTWNCQCVLNYPQATHFHTISHSFGLIIIVRLHLDFIILTFLWDVLHCKTEFVVANFDPSEYKGDISILDIETLLGFCIISWYIKGLNIENDIAFLNSYIHMIVSNCSLVVISASINLKIALDDVHSFRPQNWYQPVLCMFLISPVPTYLSLSTSFNNNIILLFRLISVAWSKDW